MAQKRIETITSGKKSATTKGTQMSTKEDKKVQEEEQAQTPSQEMSEAIEQQATTDVKTEEVSDTSAHSETAETEPAVEVQKEPAKEEAPKMTAWDAKIAEIKLQGTDFQKMVVETLEKYIVDMRPKTVITETLMNQSQLQLWRVIRLTLESEEEFAACYPLIIAYFKHYANDVFDERYLFRGSDTIPLDAETMKYFLGSLNVLKIAASVNNRRDVPKQVDLGRVMNENVFSGEARNRVIAFFSR